MTDKAKQLLTSAAIVVAGAFISADASNAQETAKEVTKITADDAAKIIYKSNKFVVDLAMMGIVSAFNSPAKIKTPSGSTDVGVSATKCAQIIEDRKFMIDLDSYKLLQDLLVDSGRLTKEKAAVDFKTHSEFYQVAMSRAPSVVKDCETVGVKGLSFSNIQSFVPK